MAEERVDAPSTTAPAQPDPRRPRRRPSAGAVAAAECRTEPARPRAAVQRPRRPPDARPARPDGAKSQSENPVLEPLFRAVRANHPKADLELLERAYTIAERITPARCARAATRTSPTRSR